MKKPGSNVEKLAEAVSDEKNVDWASALQGTDSDERELIEALETIENVTTKLRSLQSDEEIAPGTRWGALEIVRRIGQGASAVVYEARDPRVDRAVALKLLRAAALSESERKSVIREAQLLARVTHPNVATVYGADTSDGRTGIWMEYLHGRTLEELLDDGPLSAKEAAMIGVDVLGALAAAHSEGVIHRDIKAQNLMREAGGRIVLMDFGIGREQLRAAEDEAFVGTPFYVAPEIFRGEPASVASDLYAVGVLLFHLVTKQFPVAADSLDSLKQAHERGEYRLLRDVRPGLPEDFVSVVERALSSDPSERYASAGAMERAILRTLGVSTAPTVAPPREPVRFLRPVLVAGAAALALALSLWTGRDVSPPPEVVRFALDVPPGQELDVNWGPSIAISPRGDALVYEDNENLYYRPLSSAEPELIPGTNLGYNPFFSPDGEWLGFYADDSTLKKVPLSGGAPVTICDSLAGKGSSASWGPDDRIVFTDYSSEGLWTVNAQGGLPEPLTTPDAADGEYRHLFPTVLSDGETVLFSIVSTDFRIRKVGALSLETGERRTFDDLGARPSYLSSGHLVFSRMGALFAAPFDAGSLSLRGSPVRVLDGVEQGLSIMRPYGAQFALTEAGTLAYIPAAEARELVWVARDGTFSQLPGDARRYVNPRLSTDGNRVATEITESDSHGIWVIDTERGGATRLTPGGDNHFPVWIADGNDIAFCSSLDGSNQIRIAAADGSGPPATLTETIEPICPSAWSAERRELIVSRLETKTLWGLGALSLDAPDAVRPFVDKLDWEWQARLSPDGKWLAYASDESFQTEVYVQPFPGPGAKTRVSLEGGANPVWGPDGRELFFIAGDVMMIADVTLEPTFAVSRPRVLFDAGAFELESDTSYDIAPDGKRFLMMTRGGTRTRVHVVLNWSQEIDAREN